jgi:ceramide glucosyltransferase
MTILTLKLLFSSLAGVGIVYYLLCICAALRYFLDPSPRTSSKNLPPVSVLIPLCGADYDASANYASFCRQDYPQFQILFGVHAPDDSAIPVVRQLMADFPDCDIDLVVCPNIIGENRKVSNLHNMLPQARHEQIVIVDSDIRVGRDFLRSTVPHLSDSQVGMVTCFYRAAHATNWASRLEAIEITAEFQPSVVVARMLEGMTFALGAAMVTTREKLRMIGGFPAVADYLADDYMLGNLIHRSGYQVCLLPYVVQTVLGPLQFTRMLRHQIRWARVKRVCRPCGYLGLILTYGTPFALLAAVVAQGSPASLVLLATALALRLLMGWLVGFRCLGDTTVRQYLWLLPVRDMLSFVIWCVSLVGRRVEWRGRVFEIAKDGRMIPQ